MYLLGIEAFLAIIENGSLSKAAEMLHLSQSSVSHRLKMLEGELGFKLIERQPGVRGITITERGRAFIAIAEKSVRLEREIEDIRSLASVITLNIGTADSISLYLLPDLYKTLLHTLPNVQPKIITQHTLETYAQIKSGDIDVGFVKRAFDMPGVIVTKILEEEMVLVRYGNPPENLNAVQPCDLEHANEIFMDWGYQYQLWHDTHWLPATPAYHVDAAHLIFMLFDSDKQWSIVPRSIFKAMQDSGPFYEQPLASKPPNRSCYLIKHSHLRADKISAVRFIEQYRFHCV
ncbi:MAG: LysR family transcriptional regulator, transcriptional activator of the cysJI operon [Clostridiales bacterium]|jgi:DNA-binding transcriptional LysR family regulator|nr:LysR family transcriptional regulator, transcriptional activator of the cysJI operon [Clostridiales bacterium]MDN5299619.1 LysR family transcriptional regulator, transcriptional activator of the cysJI operon [Clostridiales bacterium]